MAAGRVDPYSAATRGIFVSAEITGDGTAQSTAHTLDRVPAQIFVSITDNNGGADAVIIEGTHTSTNVVLTVTNLAKYKFLAMG